MLGPMCLNEETGHMRMDVSETQVPMKQYLALLMMLMNFQSPKG